MTKQEMFEAAVVRVSMGQLIDVIDASGCSTGVCIGDFRDIGWSERVATRSSLYYRWNGPSAIRVGGEIIEPGSSTEEVEMDWS
jgi:hypothetical protein